MTKFEKELAVEADQYSAQLKDNERIAGDNKKDC